MAEYIDREKIRISALHTIKVDGTDYIPLAMALNGINQAPTEDVVPRSEVEGLQKRIENQREEINKLRNHTHNLQQSRNHYKAKADRLGKQLHEVIKNQDKAKQEVARAIFEEIETRLLSYSRPTFNDKNKAIIELNTDIYESLAELEKKYIGD